MTNPYTPTRPHVHTGAFFSASAHATPLTTASHGITAIQDILVMAHESSQPPP